MMTSILLQDIGACSITDFQLTQAYRQQDLNRGLQCWCSHFRFRRCVMQFNFARSVVFNSCGEPLYFATATVHAVHCCCCLQVCSSHTEAYCNYY